MLARFKGVVCMWNALSAVIVLRLTLKRLGMTLIVGVVMVDADLKSYSRRHAKLNMATTKKPRSKDYPAKVTSVKKPRFSLKR